MTDDDRRLADRLRRYESRVPVHDEEPVVRPRPVPWAALAGVAAVLVLAVVLATAVLQREPRVGEPSPSPDASASAPAGLRELAEIQSVDLSADGRQLDIAFLGGVCHDFEAETDRTDEVLEVTVFATMRVLASGEECPAAEEVHELRLDLDPPFAGREIRDGATGAIFPVGIASASASPDPDPAATLAPSGPIVRWAPVAVFSEEGWATEVTGMVHAGGHFIAVGYREPDDIRGRVGPPTAERRMWISTDGREWQSIDVPATFGRGYPSALIALPDGSVLTFGPVDPDSADPGFAMWRSTDGQTWVEIDGALPGDGASVRVVGGPRGLVAVVDRLVSDEPPEAYVDLWFSADGSSWEKVHEIGPEGDFVPSIWDVEAGPEGFVMAGDRYRFVGDERERRALVLASGDGRAWFEADGSAVPALDSQLLVPVGGDWMIIGERAYDERPAHVETWFSANGLSWEARGAFDIPLPSNPDDLSGIDTFVGEAVSTGERVIVSGYTSVCCHGPAWAAGVWSSADGNSWERLGFPDGTAVTAAAESDGVIVLGGFDRGRPEDEFKARAVFWIGERE